MIGYLKESFIIVFDMHVLRSISRIRVVWGYSAYKRYLDRYHDIYDEDESFSPVSKYESHLSLFEQVIISLILLLQMLSLTHILKWFIPKMMPVEERARCVRSWIEIYIILTSLLLPLGTIGFIWLDENSIFQIELCNCVIWLCIYFMIEGLVATANTSMVEVYDSKNKPYSTQRSIYMILARYVGCVLCFALLYWMTNSVEWGSESSGSPRIFELLYFSVVTITTLGYGDMLPLNGVGRFLVGTEVVTGLFLTLIALGRLLGLSIDHWSTADCSESNQKNKSTKKKR